MTVAWRIMLSMGVLRKWELSGSSCADLLGKGAGLDGCGPAGYGAHGGTEWTAQQSQRAG